MTCHATVRWWLLAVWLVTAGFGCTRPAESITLATTTSVQDSGLLDVLVPRFQERTGIVVKVVAVGSGQALELGRRGDADVLLTHTPSAEKTFIAEGYGTERKPVMYNDFVLVGPHADPAAVRQARSIVGAFAQIAEGQHLFVSRGDASGTHDKELSIWRAAAITPQGPWYLQAGSGMAHALRLASEKRAYTLTDRGTFLSLEHALELAVLSQGDPLLKNEYAVILVDGSRHPHVRADAAGRFADFLLSPEIQAIIGRFGVETHGRPLFFAQSTAQNSTAPEHAVPTVPSAP